MRKFVGDSLDLDRNGTAHVEDDGLLALVAEARNARVDYVQFRERQELEIRAALIEYFAKYRPALAGIEYFSFLYVHVSSLKVKAFN